MTWMNKASGGFPLYLASARGARVTDIDGHSLTDFSLGDTAAMAGHSPPPSRLSPIKIAMLVEQSSQVERGIAIPPHLRAPIRRRRGSEVTALM